jgi:PhzF family phenazine biosynthesis protein
VCVLPEPRDAEWMQNVAREMNLSETAFLLRQNDGFNLRWFTPGMEVNLCGHATLASAHVLWEEQHLPPDAQARFHTRSGLLTADRNGDWIEMNFPAEPAPPAATPTDLERALGVTAKHVGHNQRLNYMVIEVDSEDTVRSAKPDFMLLATLPVMGFILTSRSASPEFDFVSRFFGPRFAINEDPVTGSAHCCLGPHWSERLGKTELLGYQASARGGVIRVRVGSDRVHVGGQAVTVMRGELLE